MKKKMKMKRVKSWLSLLLSAAVLFAMDVPATAAEGAYDRGTLDAESEEAIEEPGVLAEDGYAVTAGLEAADEEALSEELSNGSQETTGTAEVTLDDAPVLAYDYPEDYSKRFLEKWGYEVSNNEILTSLECGMTGKAFWNDVETFKTEMWVEANKDVGRFSSKEKDDSDYYEKKWSGPYINPFIGTYYELDSYHAKNCEISINGAIGYGDSREFVRCAGNGKYGYYVNKERTMYICPRSGTEYPADRGNKIKINIKNIPEEERIDAEGANSYVLNIMLPPEIDGSVVEFNLDDGIYIRSDSVGTEESLKGYRIVVLANDEDPYYSTNEPTASVNRTLGDYEISYYSEVPFLGKLVKPNTYDTGRYGDIYVSCNGKTYKVKKAKLVRLKNAPANQGPYPTVSNAAVQILKLEGKSKEVKEIQKKMKKLTKVDKKKSWEAQALPLIIYPWRLTERTQNERTSRTRSNSNDVEVIYLKGKQGKYSLKINALGEIKLKNGAKDSFKTGVQQISYDREKGIISANSADIWTGPKGLPVSANRVYDYTKGK